MLSVQINGLNELLKDVDRAGGDAKPLVRASLQNSTGRIQRNVRNRAPHRTGTLQRSVLNEVNYPEGKVEVQEKYGDYLEHGTGIYGKTGQRITPRSAKVLYFKVAGKPVFAKSVKGMKARPFFKPGVEESMVYVNEQFIKVIEILVRELAGR